MKKILVMSMLLPVSFFIAAMEKDMSIVQKEKTPLKIEQELPGVSSQTSGAVTATYDDEGHIKLFNAVTGTLLNDLGILVSGPELADIKFNDSTKTITYLDSKGEPVWINGHPEIIYLDKNYHQVALNRSSVFHMLPFSEQEAALEKKIHPIYVKYEKIENGQEPRIAWLKKFKKYAISPDRTKIVSLDNRGRVKLWDISTETALDALVAPQQKDVVALSFNGNGDKVIITTQNKGTLNYDVIDNPKVLNEIKLALQKENKTIKAKALSPKGGRIAVLEEDGNISLWDAKTGALLKKSAGKVPGSAQSIRFANGNAIDWFN